MIPVILAGGSGTRLWPLSRAAFPKQFLPLAGQLTMLQQTAARLDGLEMDQPIVVCSEDHRFLVAEQLRQQDVQAKILLEPCGRNTAPAIALAAMQAQQQQPDAILLVLAADHVIENSDAFQAAVRSLLPAVRDGQFGTLGIVPTEAATGYGYLKAGTEIGGSLKQVEQFVEKPDATTAEQYVASGQYYWNSGMFMLRADRYLDALERYQPQMFAACQQAMASTCPDMDFVRVDNEAFAASPSDSIDYAVMEPLTATADSPIVVAPLDAGWSDVGSWSALWEISPKDEQGNACLGSGADCHAVLQDTSNSLVFSERRLVATLGVDNLVVIDTPDAVLVADKDKVQDVKTIVSHIRDQGRDEHIQHREVYRPWGSYDSIGCGDRYQVKRITVNPGAKLSVQMHHHRAEHWIVVSGTARVTNGDDTYLVTENCSTYIPVGQVHALENPGVIPLEMIEVQSGSYLGEDDIVRLEDRYGRV